MSAAVREIADDLLSMRRLIGDMLDGCAGDEVPCPGEAARLTAIAQSVQRLVNRAVLTPLPEATPAVVDRYAQVVMGVRLNARADGLAEAQRREAV